VDGISLLPLINGTASVRKRSMGFWDYPAKGIRTPSAKWMGELLKAQRSGMALPPNESSMKAAELPNPKYSETDFPGHSALVDGDWKLHRIESKNHEVTWELYDLGSDPVEAINVSRQRSGIVDSLRPKLVAWLASVAGSLNGSDYKGKVPVN